MLTPEEQQIVEYLRMSSDALKRDPVFWYRPLRDGLYEGPIHNAAIENGRERSGTWVPLYATLPAQQEPVSAQALTDSEDARQRAGEAVSAFMAQHDELDWCDARNVDALLDVIDAAMQQPNATTGSKS